MKRTFIKMLPLVAAVLLATSCSKDSNDDSNVVIDNPIDDTPNTEVVVDNQVKMVPFSITVNKNTLSKASLESESSLQQVFETGDQLEIRDKSTHTTLVTLDLTEGAGKISATFSKEISEGTLINGTKYDVVLTSTVHTECGREWSVVKTCTSLQQAFQDYGYLTSELTYGEQTSIQLVQNTVFLRVKPFYGTTTATINGKPYTAQSDGVIYLAVASGTPIESNLFSGTKIVTNALGKVVKNIDRSDCIAGAFSVAAGKQIFFSKGNLQYNVDDEKWRFAEHQYDYVGGTVDGNHVGNVMDCTNDNLDGPWIDLFGWVGESSKLNAAPEMYGVSVSVSNEHYGTDETESLKSDWGNVPGIGKGWSTLSKAQWEYLLGTSDAPKNNNGLGTITIGSNTYFGLIILPDGYTKPADVNDDFVPGKKGHTYSERDWTAMESAGAVFLPAAGYREGSFVCEAGSYGLYWSSSAGGDEGYDGDNEGSVSFVNFQSNYFEPAEIDHVRRFGLSVRLVRSL